MNSARIDDVAVKPCNVAVVGAGYMAREHLRALGDVPGVALTGIHSLTRARAEAVAAEFGVSEVYGSIGEMYERTKADLLVVAVPELAANAVSRAAFEYPWTVLLEKPAGYNVADAEDIERCARERGRRAYVALNRRHYGSTRAVLADLAGQGGRRLIKIQDQENPIAALKAGQPRVVVKNWMYANAIHLIDYFTFLGRGRITEVMPVLRWDAESPSYVVAALHYDSGDVGVYEAVWNSPGPWAVTVNTPEKRWEMRPVEKAAFQMAGKRTLEPFPDAAWDTAFKPGLRRQAELAVQAARGGQVALPTLADALQSMRLAQAIYA